MPVTIVRPGMLTTVQDLGRWGYQHSGIPVAGPMDSYSHRLANRMLGNPEDAAALEITLIGPELEVSEDVRCVLCGALFEATVGGVAVDVSVPFVVGAGERLRFGARRAGARATLAFRGGIDVDPVFGSRATSVVARMGPFGGRPLLAGDRFSIGRGPARERRPGRRLGLPDGGAQVRAIAGPHESMFTSAAVGIFFSSRFVVSTHSNRMGYRLQGPAIAHSQAAEILSDATPVGSVQVPASGQPILLMADRQTTGGYPKIATVISADLPRAGQLAPGDWIQFARCSRDEALAALRAQEQALCEDRA